MPDNFNPYAPSGANAPGTKSCIYQTLFYINGATGVYTPLLATSYKWTDNNLNLVVTTRSGVKWSNGDAFTAADVAFTFNYMKTYPTMDVNGIWTTNPLVSVIANNATTVTFLFKKPDTPAALAILYGTDGSPSDILPYSIWHTITSPSTYTNTSPVGTGPFTLSSFSTTSIVYAKNAQYWGAAPSINEVVFSSVDSNTTAELELENGTIDMSYDAISDPAKTYSAKSKYNDYFWPQTNMNYLYFNTAKPPFSQVPFRKAVAEAMNPTLLAKRAYFGTLAAATGGMEADVIPAQVSGWVPKSLASLEWTFSDKAAIATLKAAGYKWKGTCPKSCQLESPSGHVFPALTILSGGPGWTDYISQIDNIAAELKPIGISATPIQEPYSTYANDASRGYFDFLLCWGNGNGPTPYYQFSYMFSAKDDVPIGKVANTNWERFRSGVITNALKSYSSSSSLTVQKADMLAIEKVVLKDVPVLALTGRGNWLDYQTRTFTGFPSATNPYNDGSASDQEGAMLVYLHVHAS
jgi:peptide/nickel transport system substrate-binding protein